VPKPRIRDLETAQRLLATRREQYERAVEELSDQLAAGRISLATWRDGVRQEMKDLHTAALIFGRGGEWETLGQADFGGLGADLRGQYRRLDELAGQVQSSVGGRITPDWISLRAANYGGNADSSFWRGVGAGFPDVPPRIRSLELGARLLAKRQEAFDKVVRGLGAQLRAGEISLEQWRAAMRREIKDLHTAALVISRGGEYGAISQADWGRLGGRLRQQYRYLDRYADRVQDSANAALTGERNFMSEEYMSWRSGLYGGAATGTYWQSVVYGMLPQVPGDGKTQCRTNCGCTLRIEDAGPTTVHVFWELGPTEHCPDCLLLADEWQPYVLELPTTAAQEAATTGLTLAGFVFELVADWLPYYEGALHHG